MKSDNCHASLDHTTLPRSLRRTCPYHLAVAKGAHVKFIAAMNSSYGQIRCCLDQTNPKGHRRDHKPRILRTDQHAYLANCPTASLCSDDFRHRIAPTKLLCWGQFIRILDLRLACSHSNPSQKIKVGRRCTPKRDPANQLPCALRVFLPVDSHTCQTPWSVFQDGPNGEPTGRCPERAGAEARRDGARCLPRSRRRHLHRRINSPGLCNHRNPHRSTPRVDRRTGSRRSTSDRGASPAPIRFPPDNFKHSLTLFSKSFSSFPRGTCSLSVSRRYLALDGVYRPIGAAFPNNPTRRQRLVVRQGPGRTGLSPSPAPLSRGLGPGPSLRSLLQTTIRAAWPPRF